MGSVKSCVSKVNEGNNKNFVNSFSSVKTSKRLVKREKGVRMNSPLLYFWDRTTPHNSFAPKMLAKRRPQRHPDIGIGKTLFHFIRMKSGAYSLIHNHNKVSPKAIVGATYYELQCCERNSLFRRQLKTAGRYRDTSSDNKQRHRVKLIRGRYCIVYNRTKVRMATTNAGPIAPPQPYFDEDEMLDDYIDDEDFGGPPPPPMENSNATKPLASNDDEYDEAYWEDMMEIEGQRQQQQQQGFDTTANSTVANHDTADQTATPDLMGEEKRNENETENGNESSMDKTNNSNNTVEEYLAARRQDNNLYNFER